MRSVFDKLFISLDIAFSSSLSRQKETVRTKHVLNVDVGIFHQKPDVWEFEAVLFCSLQNVRE